MGLYDEEVDCWIANHSGIYLFFFGLTLIVGSLLLIPFELYWWIRYKIRRNK